MEVGAQYHHYLAESWTLGALLRWMSATVENERCPECLPRLRTWFNKTCVYWLFMNCGSKGKRKRRPTLTRGAVGGLQYLAVYCFVWHWSPGTDPPQWALTDSKLHPKSSLLCQSPLQNDPTLHHSFSCFLHNPTFSPLHQMISILSPYNCHGP